jgi:hypothetical protein
VTFDLSEKYVSVVTEHNHPLKFGALNMQLAPGSQTFKLWCPVVLRATHCMQLALAERRSWSSLAAAMLSPAVSTIRIG